MSFFSGTSGDDSIAGGFDPDTIDITQGGEDTVQSDAGDDFIYLGASLDAGDRIDGGAGLGDQVWLSGDYSAGLTLADATLVNVERVILQGSFDYDLTLAAGNAVNGIRLTVTVENELVAGHVRVDASAFTTGHGVSVGLGTGGGEVTGGAGSDVVGEATESGNLTFSGGGGADSLELHRLMTRADRFDGGDGADELFMLFNGGDVTLTGKMLKSVETLYCGIADYGLTMTDALVARGVVMTVKATYMEAGQHLTFDGSAERNGAYDVTGGEDSDTILASLGADTIDGGNGDDLITGGAGADVIAGGDGADTFVYLKLSDSGHHKQFDLITDLNEFDLIDLSAIDANSGKAGNQAFHIFDHFTGAAGQLVLSYNAGKDLTTLGGDVDGDGKADISIHISGDHTDFTGIVL